MVLFIATAIVITTSLLITAILRIRNFIGNLLSLYLLSLSNITLTAITAGLINQLNNPFAFLFLHLVFFFLAYLAWKRAGKPPLFLPDQQRIKTLLARGRRFAKKYPGVSLFLFFVVLSLSFAFLIALIVLPNSHDSMTTHMSRIGYWLQNGNFFSFPTHNARQVYYPLNPALQVLWTIVLTGSDRFANLVQWVAVIAAMLSIIGISRLLNLSKVHALVNALLFASFPVVIMQSSTTQTDLVVAAFISCGIFFLISGIKRNRRSSIILSSLSFSLAIGAKQTTFLVLPGVLVLWVLLLFKHPRRNLSFLKSWMVSFFIFLLLFGSTTYLINFFYFSNPFGPPGTIQANMLDLRGSEILVMVKTNALRHLYTFIDPIGLPSPFREYVVKLKAYLFQPFFDLIGINLEGKSFAALQHPFSYLKVPNTTEDEAWFGLLGFCLLSTGMIINLVKGIKNRDPLRLGLLWIAFLYFLCILLFRPGWDPYQGRYFLTIAAIITPLIYFPISKSFMSTLAQIAIILIAIFFSFSTHLLNGGKPIIGQETIWKMDRIDKITVQNRSLREVLRWVYIKIPPNTTLGLCIDSGLWDYPLFEDGFTRTVIPIEPKMLINQQDWIKSRNIKYILINTKEKLWDELPVHIDYFYEIAGWKFFDVVY